MAEIRSLSGEVIDETRAVEKNPEVGDLLRKYLAEYEKGEIAFMGIVIARGNGAARADWAWGDASRGDRFPWFLSQAGAISMLLHDYHAASRLEENRTMETGAPPDAT
jgi:hypothetical protein